MNIKLFFPFFIFYMINCVAASSQSTITAPSYKEYGLANANSGTNDKNASGNLLKALPTNVANTLKMTIIPHSAEYEVSLDKRSTPEGITDVKGTVTIKIVDMNNLWMVTQETIVLIYFADGSVEQVQMKVKQWEAKDGSSYDFDVNTPKNLENYPEEDTQFEDGLISSVKGSAFFLTNQRGIVQFTEPSNMPEISLPANTVFPTGYMKKLLEAISKNSVINSDGSLRKTNITLPDLTVFDATSKSLEPVEINTIVTGPFDPKMNISIKEGKLAIDATRAWRVTSGVFLPGSKELAPEYEQTLIVMEGGIIVFKQVPLNEGALNLTLKKLVFFD